MYCKKDKLIRILHSGAGYYIGTLEDGMPYCRISSDYAHNLEDAKELKCDRQYYAIECIYCNGGGGCFNAKED